MTDLHAELSPTWPAESVPNRVMLMMHGYGSNERDLAGLASYLPSELPWVSLRAPLSMGYGAWAWFPLADDNWLRQEPIEAATDAVWDWVDTHLAQGTRIVGLGFSQGGLMATQLLRTRPERVDATINLSGFVLDAEQPGDATIAATKPSVFWGRGDADRVIPPAYVASTRAFLSAHSTLTSQVYNAIGHTVSDEELRDVKDYLSRRLTVLSD
jgi:phospholipase/carboxylesterase